ncbi:hypothetical protein Misp01_26600 [Microtetraspora sp. NBRC 13810]|uniref:hypothetical protein n=1 Tax=Microtetraspora sp. NBRC 13810 TaxID=3030990 RepID=UPI0024A16C97|nr:hypothetical protein [Microtetraspora sp. NBRC 13810]GLW07530.1 hypothetical protein Misp01_26600 [Microtetraspora sp. NBRC 13810]
MADVYDAPLDMIKLLYHAVRSFTSDEDVRRLRTMAEACRTLHLGMSAAHEQLAPVDGLLVRWEGADADLFKENWGRLLDPAYRVEAIERLDQAANLLEVAADVSAETRRAFEKLLQGLVASVVIGAAVSAASAGAGAWWAWARTADTTVKTGYFAGQAMGRFRSLYTTVGDLMRTGAVDVGRSRLVRGLGPKGAADLTFKAMMKESQRVYWQVYRWSLGSNLAVIAASNRIRGLDPFDRSLASIAQAVNSAAVGGAAGITGGTSALGGMPAWRRNFVVGSSAGAVSQFWNERTAGNSWAETVRNTAQAALMAGGFNVLYVGVGASKTVGDAVSKYGSQTFGRYWHRLSPQAQGSAVSLAPNTSMRVMLPFVDKPAPLDLPETGPLPGDGG